MKRVPTLILLCAGLLMTPALFAQTPWIHVAVSESGEKAANVKINLPLSVVQVALEAAPEHIVSKGHIHLNHADQDIDIENLRKMWNELRESGDADLVTVEKDDETVTIRRDGDYLRIHVDKRGEDEQDEEVRIDVPVSVVDALLAGDGDELNLRDALSELGKERGDVVRVETSDTKVRIWIDES